MDNAETHATRHRTKTPPPNKKQTNKQNKQAKQNKTNTEH